MNGAPSLSVIVPFHDAPAHLERCLAGLARSSVAAELVLGLSMGIAAAVRRGRPADQALMVTAFVFVSAPQFVVGILLLYVFAVQLGWFPIGGYGTAAHVVLPALTLGLIGAGWYGRIMRSSLIDVLTQDFVRTARAKGLGRARVLFRHALPNAVLLPHVGSASVHTRNAMGQLMVDNLTSWFASGKPLTPVPETPWPPKAK